jgi:regulator of replication initiation timing
MSNVQSTETLQPGERDFGALIERVSNMTKALDRMATETNAMRGVVESIRTDQIKLQAEIKLVSSQLERTEKELRAEIERNSIKKVWSNLTSIVAGLVSILALLVALGVVKGAG